MEEKNSDMRAKLVEAAKTVWIERLMDTSRRNNLLYFRDLQKGTIDLSKADPELIYKLFEGEKVATRRLFPTDGDGKENKKFVEIRRKAQTNLEEKGLKTLFLAFGMATWEVDDEGRPPEAAVVLLPIDLEGKSSDLASLAMRATGSPQANLALLHALSEEHNLNITAEELLESGYAGGEIFIPSLVLDHLQQLANGIKGFQLNGRIVIGNFSFQKMSMVRDLREAGATLAAHEIVAALSGDVGARQALGGIRVALEPRMLDKVPASDEFMVLDADSSQQLVVHSVAAGINGVIMGPPGCGKSQTIANTITTLVAQGKRVLFVAEKRAALEAVHKRLAEKGLDHLTLDLHGATISQKAVMARVNATLEKIRGSHPVDDRELHQRFEDRRNRVASHAEEMHQKHLISGLTAYQLQSLLMEIGGNIASKTRWRESDLAMIPRDNFLAIGDLIVEAQSYDSLVSRKNTSEWTNAKLTDGAKVQQTIDAARNLTEQDLPSLNANLELLSAQAKLSKPTTIGDTHNLITHISAINSFLSAWTPEVFQHSNAHQALSPAERGGLVRVWATLFNSGYRNAIKNARACSKNAVREPKQLLAMAGEAARLAEEWRKLCDGRESPHAIEFPAGLSTALQEVGTDIGVLQQALPGIEAKTLAELIALTSALASDQSLPYDIPTVRRIESEISRLGGQAILNELRSSNVPTLWWKDWFIHAYYASCYESLRAQHPGLASFRGEVHSNYTAEFCNLDRDRLRVASARISRAHATHAVEEMNRFPEQAQLVRAEAQKRSRHMPIRMLLAKAPEVFTAICPCWMSSPLNVSQLVGLESQVFDVVVFDEASQVLTEDAICAIMRGKRLVVAGDKHQLPPTTFFADGADDGEIGEATSGFESLLDALSAFVDHWPLDWHYRSRDERLIAFSNRHIYSNRLTTFPGIGGTAAVSHVFVDSLPRDGDDESCSVEVERVVSLILEHAQEQVCKPSHAWESLGVIAMGIKHSNRIQALLDRKLFSRRDLEDFFDPNREERVFVKNLEQVQGDERDAIILTIGYGKDRNGKLPYRFGPLLLEGGERRLNVAISRAKRRMTVVSSFTHQDMDPNRSNRKGVEMLRLFLQYASSGGSNLGDLGISPVQMNAFEADVHDALQSRGLNLISQYGVSGYRLDFAVTHPTLTGKFVLAIECDGASYHSAPTARDRDRLRQQQLESIGWRFHRIWSTDWFLHREQQIEKAVKAWEGAVRLSDGLKGASLEMPSVLSNESELVKEQLATPSSITVRPPKPEFLLETDISLYLISDIAKLVHWVQTDGLLRTNEELITELVRLLGFQRRGPKIVAAITKAIELNKRTQHR